MPSIRDDFSVLTGNDNFALPMLAIGGHGVISVVSNFAPNEMCTLYKCMQNKETEYAQKIGYKIAELSELLFFRPSPIPVKAALELKLGVPSHLRLPMTKLNETDFTWLKNELIRTKWL